MPQQKESVLFAGDTKQPEIDLSDEALTSGAEKEAEEKEEKKEQVEGKDEEKSGDDKGSDPDNDKEENKEKDKKVTDSGTKTLEDAEKIRKDDQRYISELQEKNKQLLDAFAPYIVENADGKMSLDTSKLVEKATEGTKLSSDEKVTAIKSFWKEFDADPITTLYKIAYDAQEAAMSPYKAENESRKQTVAIDKFHTEKYKEYGDLRNDVKSILSKDKVLSALGDKGVEIAFKDALGDKIPDIVKQVKGKKEPVSTAPSGVSSKSSEESKSKDNIHDQIHGAADKGVFL